ncbi:MAG TPA: hypothetical protein DDW52_30070 [Planctomycetaceae bacterium]|nr:hypothetical protein [Planctomycetaceae bacterium]
MIAVSIGCVGTRRIHTAMVDSAPIHAAKGVGVDHKHRVCAWRRRLTRLTYRECREMSFRIIAASVDGLTKNEPPNSKTPVAMLITASRWALGRFQSAGTRIEVPESRIGQSEWMRRI